MKNPHAILVFARTPEISRVSRDEPFAALPWEDVDAIFHACTGDILQQALDVPDADVLLYRTAGEFPDGILLQFGDRPGVFDLPRGDFGTAVQQAVDGAFLEEYHRVLAVIEIHPLMTTAFFRRAIDQLGTDDDCVVVCPTDDDRVAMVSLKAASPALFTGNARKAIHRPSALMERLCALDALMFLMPPLSMLDTPSRLDRLRSDLDRFEPDDPEFPKRTAAVFRSLEKKYRIRKGAR